MTAMQDGQTIHKGDMMTNDLRKRMTLPEYPRSAKYDPQWQIDTMMGPNALWITESVTQVIDLKPGMRVLDLGCGMAASSIFLAKEFGVQVWATDLWIGATENFIRIREAGVDDRVFPIHAEAHALPYADGFFDAIVSMDAYQYFGTDALYAPKMVQLLKPGGQFGIAVPGLTHELTDGVPEHMKPYWETEFWCFHSATRDLAGSWQTTPLSGRCPWPHDAGRRPRTRSNTGAGSGGRAP